MMIKKDIRTRRSVNKLYKTYNEGFYVNAERDLTNIKQRNIYEIIKKSNARKMSFKERLIETFGVNLFKCIRCGSDMILWEVWHHKYGIIYNVLDKLNYIMIADNDIGKEEIEECMNE